MQDLAGTELPSFDVDCFQLGEAIGHLAQFWGFRFDEMVAVNAVLYASHCMRGAEKMTPVDALFFLDRPFAPDFEMAGAPRGERGQKWWAPGPKPSRKRADSRSLGMTFRLRLPLEKDYDPKTFFFHTRPSPEGHSEFMRQLELTMRVHAAFIVEEVLVRAREGSVKAVQELKLHTWRRRRVWE